MQEIILGIISLINFLVGLHVLVRNPRNIVNLSFFTFVFGIAFWGMGMVLLLSTGIFFFDKIILFGGIIMVAGITLLSKTFPDLSRLGGKFALFFVPLFLIAIFLPFNVFVEKVSVDPGRFIVPTLGPMFPLFAAVIAAYLIFSTALFTKNYLTASGIKKLQMRYLFAGAAIFLTFVFVSDVALPAIGIFSLNLIGPMTSIVFVWFTAYAILRHRLLDMRIIVMRTVSFLILITVVAAAYASVMAIFIQVLADITVSAPLFMIIVAVTTVAILAFQPLEGMVRRLTKNLFFKGRYDSGELLEKLSRILTSTLNLEYLSEQALDVLTKAIGVGKAAFLVVENHNIVAMNGVGYRDHEYASKELEQLIHGAAFFDSVCVYEEQTDVVKETFRSADIAVAVLIQMGDREVAILILGPKSSGEIYYENDIKLLRRFAREAGIAIQNAESYSEIKRLNEGLEQLVEERTKQLKETQERELAKAREVARLKDEFVFIAVHELRAPVAAMRGFLQLIEEINKDVPFKVRDYLSSINIASSHLKQLVDDILEIARSEAGSVKINVQSISIIPVLEKILKELLPLAKERKISIQFEKQETLPMILANAEKLEEVFTNLISNGIKYNKIGGTLTVRIVSNKENMAIEVEDAGLGIPQGEQQKVFDKFFRGENQEVRSVKGTGLGLFITRMLVEKMGGNITFKSKEKQGTTFTVVLPLFKEKVAQLGTIKLKNYGRIT